MPKPTQTILTLGLELEMLIHQPPTTCINHTLAHLLRSALSTPFTTPNPHILHHAPSTPVGFAKPMLIAAAAPCATPIVDWIGDAPNHRHYLITSKPDLVTARTPTAAGVEIRTPILRLGSWRAALAAIVSAFSNGDVDIGFPSQCGLHVHIGCRGGFGLAHIKGVAKAVLVFEGEIERRWHPLHRRGGRGGLYACSNRDAVALRGLRTREMVKLVEAQETVGGVRSVVCDVDVGMRDFKYNFQSLVELGTVEFRQAQACLEEEWIAGWVGMLVRLVRAAECVGEGEWEGLVEGVEEGVEGLEEFLKLGEGKTRRKGEGGGVGGYGDEDDGDWGEGE